MLFLKKEGLKNSWMAKIVMIVLLGLITSEICFSSNGKNTNDAVLIQQKIKISGRVVDKDGFPMPGVNVVIKSNKNFGVATDVEGRYAIECNPDEILIFSMLGYKQMEMIAKDINGVAITLEEDTVTMDEVVVVAFGKQKKESVVSSISTVNPGELIVPSSNLTTAFAGRLAGVIAYQRSGEPGLDNAEFFIRGVTTFSTGGKKDPLILIDGIEMEPTDLARINADDIASFSVLKDANSAALYGSRGANGVILVTTKEGIADNMSINIRAELSSSGNSELVKLADPITYMRLHNEAVKTRNPMVSTPYSSEKIYNTERGINPLIYPAVDWYDYMIKDRTFNQRFNTQISGGGKAVQYFITGNLQHDTGILKESANNMLSNNIDVLRFQLRSNITIKLTPNTQVIVRSYGAFDDQHGPIQGGQEVFMLTRSANPVMFMPYYPKDESTQYINHIMYGKLDPYYNPLAEVASGYKDAKTSMMLSQIEVEHRFDNMLKGLILKGTYNIKRNSYYDLTRSYKPFYYTPVKNADGNYQLFNLNPEGGTEYLDYTFGRKSVTSTMYGEFRAGYQRLFVDRHDINITLVGSLRDETNTEVTTIQQSLPKRNISTAARLAYGYDSKYFIEGNFGYNGSERFDKKHRYGFFPSIGAGWMVTNESFMKGVEKALTSLKLKATYGLVGNDQIGRLEDRFFYLSQVNLRDANRGYYFGQELNYYQNGISLIRYANDLITWEKAKKMNIGIEMTLFKDLTINADYFTERRSNILLTRTDIPTTLGLVTTPQHNVGVGKGVGAETELKYQKYFNKDLQLIINGNFTYASSEYLKYEEPDFSDIPWRSRIGQKISQPFGYIAERHFIDEEEVKNSPKQTFGEYGAGDIKYKDISGDGQINSDDQVPIGLPTTPEINYGIGFTLKYKCLDFSCFFQGEARTSFMIAPQKIQPFVNNDLTPRGQSGLLEAIANDYWSENNRNLYAFWPRLSEAKNNNNTQPSTWWLRDGSFLRLKSAEIGYTLSENLTKKAHIKMARIYANGMNLALLWSNFNMWDPEMDDGGLGYPIQQVINLGLNIQF